MVERPDELESERIQQDIERTRQQMSGTIDEIQERLTPSRLLHEATASVREAGAGSVRRVLSHARARRRAHGWSGAGRLRGRGWLRGITPAAGGSGAVWPGPRAGTDVPSPAAKPVHLERRGVQRMGRSPPTGVRRSMTCTSTTTSTTGPSRATPPAASPRRQTRAGSRRTRWRSAPPSRPPARWWA